MDFGSLPARYASAFYQTAKKKDILPQVRADIDVLRTLYKDVPQLADFLTHPRLTPEQKIHTVGKLFEKRLHPGTLHFLHFLIKKKRGQLLDAVLQEVAALDRIAHHQRMACLTSAQPLSNSLKKELITHIQQLTHEKNIQLVEKVDPTLLGGYLLKVGDQQLDRTLRSQLTQLQAHWEKNDLPDPSNPASP